MSKMDRQLNSKKDEQTIYEIYRACRLCGAGAGYKMPIIQNVVDIDDTDVELKQKVRDCVQIEVHQDDKMPPLICELCVDKVNDFYEFLEMCRQTNKRTRLRLGLPPQSMPRGAPDAGECILGLTEPVYVNEDSDGEPLSKQKKLNPKVKVKKEPELRVKLENRILTESRPSRFSKRPPTPPRMTRHRTHSKDENMSLSCLKNKSKSMKVAPKSILKKDIQNEDSSLLTPRVKRARDKEPVKLETPSKKVKISPKTASSHTRKPSPLPKSSPRVINSSKSPKLSPKQSPPPMHKCVVCGQMNKTPQANISHMKVHGVSFTNPRLACNPCGLWFASVDEATTHHKRHKNQNKPYTCRRCTADFKHLSAYNEHFENNQCVPWFEVPDVKCDVCWRLFATNNLLDLHKCLGEDYRPGGRCGKCKRNYTLLRNLKKHEETCTARKKGEFIVDPVLLSKLKPIQIRVSRCDPLLNNLKQEHYDVSNVTADFGLDKNSVYPYISTSNIKSDLNDLDKMVAIKQEVKEEFCTEEDYVHWDSEDSESDDELTCSLVLNPLAKKKRVDTLANLTLKTLFSKRCLGRVPKKRRRVKQEKSMFDSLLANETEDDVTRDINNIIDNLGNDDDEFDKSDDKNKELNVTDKSMDVSDDTDCNVVDGKETHNVVDQSVDVVDKDTDVDKNTDVVDTDIIDKNTDIVDKNTDGVDKDTDMTVDKDIQDIRNVADNDVVHEKNDDDVNLAGNNSPDKHDQNNAQNDVKFSDAIDNIDETVEKNDVVEQNYQSNASINICEDHEKKDIESATENVNSVCKDTSGSNNNLSSNNERIDGKVNNGTINNRNNISIDSDDPILSKNENCSKDISSSVVSKDENQNDGAQNVAVKNDFENNQDTNSIDTASDSILNDNTQIDAEIENNDKVNIDNSDNATSLVERNTVINEDEFSIGNFTQDSKVKPEAKSKDSIDQRNEEQSDKSQVNDNVNDNKNAISVIVNSGKTKNSIDSDEIDDSKLMEALNAQIGEGNDNSREQINYNDKLGLDDLVTDKNREMDISEEFNFDA